MNTLHSKIWYAKKWSIDILIDILGGIFIALGTYNFAAAAEFPMVGVNGIALIFYQLWGLPIGRTAMLLNIPIAVFCFKVLGRRFFLRSVRTILITSFLMDMLHLCFLFMKVTGCLLLSALVSCQDLDLP